MNKVGVTSVGAYIPYYYIDRGTIGKAWGTRGSKGVRSIANSDEDSVTMAVEAAADCFRYVGREKISALYFASTTAPYAEKSHAALISTACDLSSGIFAADFTCSLQSATSAFKAALDAAASNPDGGQILVTAADCRNAYPKSPAEQMLGDAGAALTVGSENVIATVEYFSSVINEINDVWRNDGDAVLSTTEQRFAIEEGYMAGMTKALKDILDKSGMRPSDITKAVLTTPGAGEYLKVAKKLGFAPEQLQDPLMAQIGDCGTAQPLLLLAAALETAKAGDIILLASYGSGSNAFILKVTDEVRKIQKVPTVGKYMDRRAEFKDYVRFLSFRGLLDPVHGEPYKIPASPAISWREQNTYLRLYAGICNKCKTGAFPTNRICYRCRSKDDYTESRRTEEITRIYSYSCDRLAGRSDDPLVIQVVADDKDNIRYYMNLTDFQEEEVKIGLEMEFTFRKIHNLAGFPNYYWKFRPVRKPGVIKDER